MMHKFVLLSHGVDNRRFENGKDAIRKEFSIPPEVKIVGNVGMLRAQKGQHLFLSVAQIVKEKYPDVKFVIAGDMYYENGMIDPTLQNLCNSLGLDDHVIFTGFLTDIENVFAAFDVFVHTSAFQESYGRTILESMSSGKPIVAFNNGGPSEIVRHGRTGFLVPPEDLRLMAERIIALLLDDELRTQMGSEGRRIIREHYSNEKYMKCLEGLYSQLL
jgi:glycosyltransferase involved in cell wall biosynthesis